MDFVEDKCPVLWIKFPLDPVIWLDPVRIRIQNPEYYNFLSVERKSKLITKPKIMNIRFLNFHKYFVLKLIFRIRRFFFWVESGFFSGPDPDTVLIQIKRIVKNIQPMRTHVKIVLTNQHRL